MPTTPTRPAVDSNCDRCRAVFVPVNGQTVCAVCSRKRPPLSAPGGAEDYQPDRARPATSRDATSVIVNLRITRFDVGLHQGVLVCADVPQIGVQVRRCAGLCGPVASSVAATGAGAMTGYGGCMHRP